MSLVDVSGIEPGGLGLLRLWIGYLTPLKQKTFSPENTPLFVIYLVDAGGIFEKSTSQS